MVNPRLLAAKEMDAHDWMRLLRFEYYRVNQLRNMRLHEQLWVGYFKGPGVTEDRGRGHCEAYFERRRGHFTFNAVWTVIWRNHTGKPTIRRPHILTWGDFKLLPGNMIEFLSDRDLEAEHTFRRVCRYVDFLSRHSRRLGCEPLPFGEAPMMHLRRGELISKDDLNMWDFPGPRIQGLAAIVETAMALGIVGEESCDA